MAVQGHYDGFRLVDVSQPKKPIDTIDYEERAPKNPTGAVPWNQGDIAIYGDILSRSWNSSTGPLGASCDGESVPPGFEGLHIFADPPVFPDGFEGGDWSTYWYNGHIYESDLVWGLLTWRINDPRVTAYYRTPSRTRNRSFLQSINESRENR